jgi:hypothetical protein
MSKPITFTPLGRVLWACVLAPHCAPVLAADPCVIDEMRLLFAIAQVETGAKTLSRPVQKVGKNGERSAWQFMPGTWREYTNVPFEQASKQAPVAHLVAQLHLRRIRLELETQNLKATPHAIAMAWNAGISAVVGNNVPQSTWSYAERVANLYQP